MGVILDYKCSECGYKTELYVGPSGLTTTEMTPFVCEKTKDIVVVSWNNPAAGCAFMRSTRSYPAKVEKPSNPTCPTCKDHALNKEWDETTCPKCGHTNTAKEAGDWD